MRTAWTTCCLIALALLTAQVVTAEDAPDLVEPTDKPAAPVDPIALAIEQINKQDNGVTVNPDDHSLDIKATVCLRNGDFLEMFACTTDTREHESILVVDAMPSTIHFGLLLLGQEPGRPLSYDRQFDPPKLVPATGPKVEVFIVQKVAGQDRETPANRWVQDNKTKEMMQNNTWLFAGSQFADFEGKQIYHADLNGSAISLVNFGDDLLTLPNKMTDANNSHNQVWAPRSKAIPKVGTKVIIRLRVKAPEAKKEQPEKEQAEKKQPEATAEDETPESPATKK